jgi:8-oxo-dGTP diphosphatase
MKKAKYDSWKSVNFPEEYYALKFKKYYTSKEYILIQNGFIPAEMEDKWFIYFSENQLYIHRSWTGYCIYVVSFLEEGNNFYINEILFNGNKEQYELINYHDLNSEKDIVLNLIDSLLLNLGNEPIITEQNANDYLTEYDEIINIFSFHDFIEGNKNVYEITEESKEEYLTKLNYTKLIDKAISKKKLTDSQLTRYMLVGLSTNFEAIKIFQGLEFNEIINLFDVDDDISNNISYKLDKYKKYSKKEIQSIEDYSIQFIKNELMNYSGEQVYEYVLHGSQLV